MAGHTAQVTAGGDDPQRGRVGPAHRHHLRAPGREPAAGPHVDRRRDFTRDGRARTRPLRPWIGLRIRRNKRLRVGMERPVEQILHACPLDDLPGVGPKRKRELLKVFGSIKRVRDAPVEQIAAVPGIGPALAARIKATLEA